MLIHMRTTLILEDSLFQAARKLAAEQQTTLSALVNDALRQLVSQPGRARKKVVLPTFGAPAKKRRVTPREIADSLLEHA